MCVAFVDMGTFAVKFRNVGSTPQANQGTLTTTGHKIQMATIIDQTNDSELVIMPELGQQGIRHLQAEAWRLPKTGGRCHSRTTVWTT